MKIKCEYCGSYIDDTNAVCPNCGSPCSGVKRAVNGQPMTIEDLKQWYQDRRLPSAETTRFFIGEDYKGSRAFGIYKEESTGNYVVYKNKDNGERAIRYRGTDESYAVNEIFQRLKQEILQQKAAGIEKEKRSLRSGNAAPNVSGYSGKGTKAAQNYDSSAGNRKRKRKRDCSGCLGSGCMGHVFKIFLLMFGIALIMTIVEDEPYTGYYDLGGRLYYYLDYYDDESHDSWYSFDKETQDWKMIWYDTDSKSVIPQELVKNKVAKDHFLQKEWDGSLECTDATESMVYGDAIKGFKVDTGYYSYNDITYYHLKDVSEEGWYYYSDDDSDWYSVENADVPEVLTHSYSASNFYDVDQWDSSTQVTDFSDTAYYKDYYDHDTGSSSTWNDNDDDDYNWYWDSDSDDDDDWSSGGDSGWDSSGTDWDSDW